MSETLLKISDLFVTFDSDGRKIPAIQGVSLQIQKGRVLGLVGESGCGKSVTSLSIMDLLDHEFSHIEGSIQLGDTELVHMPVTEMQKIRGNKISMVFQEPMTSLNPVYTVDQQISEVLMLHQNKSAAEAHGIVVEMLKKVGLADPERIARSYPHSLSGGQRQRVMIAMALCCQPLLLICDEPTTALDVTIQAQVLDLLRDLQRETGTSILFITHDLGVIAEIADDVAVMYAGRIVETTDIETIFDTPLHPYTQGLMASRTDVGEGEIFTGSNRKLPCIPGNVPTPNNLPKGCSFAPRCDRCMGKCMESMPELFDAGNGHMVRCWLYEKGAK
ncbi:MAG: ABC transporter ATP-binding protein [Clostridia bacterium]|nr:ABC transporter ATP-binding protein [Clostridia bacterium]